MNWRNEFEIKEVIKNKTFLLMLNIVLFFLVINLGTGDVCLSKIYRRVVKVEISI